VGFSKSTNHYENPNNFTALSIFTDSNLGIRFTGHSLDSDAPGGITQTAGADMYALNSYRPNQGNLATEGQRTNHGAFVSNNVRHSSEVRWSGRLDVQRDLRLAFPAYVKAGFSYNETIRDKRQPQRRWYWVGDDGIAGTADDTTAAGAQLGRFAEPVPVTTQLSGFNLREPQYLSTVKVFEHWQANPRVLVDNLAYAEEQLYLGKRKVNEAITGYYLLGNATFRKLNVLAGVRVEETDIVAQGSRTLPTTGPRSVLPAGVNANSLEGVRAKYRFQTIESGYRSDPFPYLHLKYELRPNLQARTSYTEGIGRPNFAQILPSLTQNDTPVDGFDGTVSSTLAGLLPQRSKNYDVSVEYYTRTAGEWSAAWFRRDINDYISSTTVPMTPELLAELNLGNEFANYRLSTSQNLGNANWSGYELSVRQKLRDWSFVPSFLHGVEVWANHTAIYEMEGTLHRRGRRGEDHSPLRRGGFAVQRRHQLPLAARQVLRPPEDEFPEGAPDFQSAGERSCEPEQPAPARLSVLGHGNELPAHAAAAVDLHRPQPGQRAAYVHRDGHRHQQAAGDRHPVDLRRQLRSLSRHAYRSGTSTPTCSSRRRSSFGAGFASVSEPITVGWPA
jgi:TonB-dependent receptor